MYALYMCGKHRWQLFNIKILSQNKIVITIYWKYSFDRNDESELAILPQKIDIIVRNGGLTALVIAFDMALTENEFGPKKIDRNDDLTALVIWPEGESLL